MIDPNSPAALAWVAGIFEGEGCWYPNKNRSNWKLLIEVSMTDEDVIRHLHKVVGFGSVTTKGRTGSLKTIYKWCCSGDAAEELAMKLIEFLGTRRRARLNEVLFQIREHNAARWEPVA